MTKVSQRVVAGDFMQRDVVTVAYRKYIARGTLFDDGESRNWPARDG